MKKFNLLISIWLLSSCASNPDNIDAAYVSPLKYANYNCNQLSQEMDYIGRRTNTLYRSLKQKRTGDAWQMGVGLVLFWPTLFALEGGDGPEATEYAQIKGEYEAVRSVSVEKSCNLNMQSPDEILSAAKEADDKATKTTKERLVELDSLLNEGVITEEEYESARKAALGIK